MPFLLAAFALLVAIVWGAVRLYDTVAAQFGTPAAVIVLAACVLLVVWAIAAMVARYRAVHGVRVGGERHLSIRGPWGELRLDADRKMGTLSLDGAETRFVFSDIAGAHPVGENGRWTLALELAHNKQQHWTIPMPDRRIAQRWTKIFNLAHSHKL